MRTARTARAARTSRLAGAVLLAGSAAVLTTAPAASAAPAAVADAAGAPITSFGYSVSPSTVAPGGTVTLRVTDCDRMATASSGVFDAVTLQGSGGTKTGTATVDSDAKPGAEYDVTFTCGSESGTAPLTITTTAPTVPVTPLTPAGGVQTGLGGSVSGPDAAEIAAGAVLVGLAGAFAVRRVRAARH